VSVVFTAVWTSLYLDLAGHGTHLPETATSH